MLTFENAPTQGATGIIEKLTVGHDTHEVEWLVSDSHKELALQQSPT